MTNGNENGPNQELALNYLNLRRIVGLLGMAMPWALWLIGKARFDLNLQSSMSAYAHTAMVPLYSGLLWVIGIFLIAYRGFDDTDNRTASVAGFGALGMSIFPTAYDHSYPPSVFSWDSPIAHVVCAGIFFAALAYMSYFQFTKSLSAKPARRKLRRNTIYKLSAAVMVGAVVALAADKIGSRFFPDLVEPIDNSIFWAEAIAIFAFGIAWYVKGEGLAKWLSDEDASNENIDSE